MMAALGILNPPSKLRGRVRLSAQSAGIPTKHLVMRAVLIPLGREKGIAVDPSANASPLLELATAPFVINHWLTEALECDWLKNEIAINIGTKWKDKYIKKDQFS